MVYAIIVSLLAFSSMSYASSHKCGRVTGKKAQDIYHVLAVKEFEAVGPEGQVMVTKTAGPLKCQKQIIPQDPDYKTAVCVLK